MFSALWWRFSIRYGGHFLAQELLSTIQHSVGGKIDRLIKQKVALFSLLL
jgi:hypothetical protein